MRVTIRRIGKNGGRISDDEICNTESDEFVTNCSSNELKARVKQLEVEYDKILKQQDKEINDLKHFLMLLLPPDKKQVIQEHFDQKAKCALKRNSSINYNFSLQDEKQINPEDLNEDKVNT